MTTPKPNPDSMSRESEEQRELFVAYRRTLALLLQQAAQYDGVSCAPPQTANGIIEVSEQIAQIKASLRASRLHRRCSLHWHLLLEDFRGSS
jgi:hypothetical protein